MVTKSLQLRDNAGGWNKQYGLLFIDQPLGTGFSTAAKEDIPTDEMVVAADLFAALNDFYARHEAFQARPLFITGESYAGKYVPSVGHYILQAKQQHAAVDNWGCAPLRHMRALPAWPAARAAPLFELGGLAVGNGLTDPRTQVLTHADVAHFMGLIDMQQRLQAMQMQLTVEQLIARERWAEAHKQRQALLDYLTRVAGVGTLLDGRRFADYDAGKAVDRYLNLPRVREAQRCICLGQQEALGVVGNATFEACSGVVGDILGPDVMKSVKHLVPDLLAHVPLLLYQGAADAQDGPASNEPWIDALDWAGSLGFGLAVRRHWHLNTSSEEHAGSLVDPDAKAPAAQAACGPVVGYWREFSMLTQVVIRNAGHMVPHDQPLVALRMLERWVDSAVARTHCCHVDAPCGAVMFQDLQ